MRAEFETAKEYAIWAVMRKAGWDPQSHDREGRVGVQRYVEQIIDILDSGGGASVLRALFNASVHIAKFLEDQGYHRATFKNQPLTPGEVETVLRESLERHFTLPAALRMVEP